MKSSAPFMYCFLFYFEILSHDVSVACLACSLVPFVSTCSPFTSCVYIMLASPFVQVVVCHAHLIECPCLQVLLSSGYFLMQHFCLFSRFCAFQNSDILFVCLFASSPSDFEFILFCTLLPSGDSVDTLFYKDSYVELSLSELCI